MSFLPFFSTRSRPAEQSRKRYRVLMVCMGNICRSPTAEVVLRRKLQEAGLGEAVEVDSAGTHAYHVGCPPDERAMRHARRRGYALDALRARKAEAVDFHEFDLILAMDEDNETSLAALCPNDDVRHKLGRLTDFIPEGHGLAGTPAVPDPYYGGPAGFDAVLDLVEAACDGLVKHIRQRLACAAAD